MIGAGLLVNSVTTETKDILHAMEKKMLERRFVANSEDDYETKLTELQACLEDAPAAHGTPILATADGQVIRSAWDEEYGYVVYIQHKIAVVTRYAHVQELNVKQGDFVTVPNHCKGRVDRKINSPTFTLRGAERWGSFGKELASWSSRSMSCSWPKELKYA